MAQRAGRRAAPVSAVAAAILSAAAVSSGRSPAARGTVGPPAVRSFWPPMSGVILGTRPVDRARGAVPRRRASNAAAGRGRSVPPRPGALSTPQRVDACRSCAAARRSRPAAPPASFSARQSTEITAGCRPRPRRRHPQRSARWPGHAALGLRHGPERPDDRFADGVHASGRRPRAPPVSRIDVRPPSRRSRDVGGGAEGCGRNRARLRDRVDRPSNPPERRARHRPSPPLASHGGGGSVPRHPHPGAVPPRIQAAGHGAVRRGTVAPRSAGGPRRWRGGSARAARDCLVHGSWPVDGGPPRRRAARGRARPTRGSPGRGRCDRIGDAPPCRPAAMRSCGVPWTYRTDGRHRRTLWRPGRRTIDGGAAKEIDVEMYSVRPAGCGPRPPTPWRTV